MYHGVGVVMDGDHVMVDRAANDFLANRVVAALLSFTSSGENVNLSGRVILRPTMTLRLPMPLLCLLLLLALTCQATKEQVPIQTTTTLSNGKDLPLLGMGVGNLQHNQIVDTIAFGGEHGIRLIDTAHASRNEHLVREGIEKSSSESDIHVITKVWYTHLGYQRTKLSVEESLKELTLASNNNNIQVHILLHWPRCRDEISWMDCEGEEERLPQYVKDLGPPPHLDKDNAHLESWRALEDLYDQDDRIASIGISNFDLRDIKTLVSKSRITPHILQGNVWTLLFDPHLMQYLTENDIHFQAYNVMNGIFSQTSRAPNAYHSLAALAHDVSSHDNDALVATPAQLVLAWLIQKQVSVIPRTSNKQHLQENAVSIEVVPTLTLKQQETIQSAVAALLRGVDLEPPKVTFYNSANQVAHLYWIHAESGEHVAVKEHLKPKESFESQTYPGHVFVAMDESKQTRNEFQVSAGYGDAQEFHIEL